MKAALVSYNTFVRGEANGWKQVGENGVLLLQNAEGKTWGVSQIGQSHLKWHEETKTIVDPLWQQLQGELTHIEKVILYVGSYGAERFIELAAAHGLTPEMVIFVFCDCNVVQKRSMLQQCGFSRSLVIPCECGGHQTMLRIFQNILSQGKI